MSAPLLVELFTEELPPKALAKLGGAFSKAIRDGLAKRGLIDADDEALTFCTPRRLATGLRSVRAASDPRAVEVKLMPAASKSGKYFWFCRMVSTRHSGGTARNSVSKVPAYMVGRSTRAVTSSNSAA